MDEITRAADLQLILAVLEEAESVRSWHIPFRGGSVWPIEVGWHWANFAKHSSRLYVDVLDGEWFAFAPYSAEKTKLCDVGAFSWVRTWDEPSQT